MNFCKLKEKNGYIKCHKLKKIQNKGLCFTFRKFITKIPDKQIILKIKINLANIIHKDMYINNLKIYNKLAALLIQKSYTNFSNHITKTSK